jgi:hypothetical protein
MDLTPEVLFHRYFQSRPHLQRDGYRRKADLDRLSPQQLPVSLLESLQAMMNGALLDENTNIPEHVPHDRFHFDYIDSHDPNALAFFSDGYSFIGVTIPLLEQLWQASTRHNESPSVTSIFDIQLTDSQRGTMTITQRIQVAAFRLQLFFIALHEFTHVVHGHVGRRTSKACRSGRARSAFAWRSAPSAAMCFAWSWRAGSSGLPSASRPAWPPRSQPRGTSAR